jgi:RHS repeat-associated protein
VRSRREFAPGEPDAPPVVTRWSEQVDLEAGTVTSTETVAAGTAAEATTAQITSLVHGGVVAEIDALGNRAVAEYDTIGRVVERRDAEGRATTTAYGMSDGQRSVSETRPDQVTRTRVEDALGRVVEVFDNVDQGEAVPGHVRRVESREYSPGVVRVTDAWGAVSSSRHDAFGRTVAATGPTGASELTEYDDTHATVRAGVSPTGDLADADVVSEQQLDAAGQVIQVTEVRAGDGSESRATSVFDGFGRVVSTRVGGLATAVEYDRLGRPIVSTLTPASADDESNAASTSPTLTATVEFDGYGRGTGKTLSDGVASRAGFTRVLDELGRTTEETDPSGEWTRYRYTVDGLVDRVETSAGQLTEVEYDATSRAKVSERVTSPIGAEVATVYEYHPVTGRMIAVADAANIDDSRIVYDSDAFGNLRTVTYPDGSVIAYEYDAHGRRTGLTDVAGTRTEYTYTDAGLLASAVQRDASGIVAEAAYTYDALGRVTGLDRGNGVRTRYTFTAADEIATERTTREGEPLTDRVYTYEAGDLIRRVDVRYDAIGDDDGDGTAVTTSTEYEYDAMHRLTGSIVREGQSPDSKLRTATRYELSIAGDVTAETVQTDPGTVDAATAVRRFDYDARGELSSLRTEVGGAAVTADQRYDPAGNLIRSADGSSSGYDAANRTVSTTTSNGSTTTTAYWPDGTRRSQRSGGVTTSFYWDGDTLLNERETGAEAEAASTASYLIGASRLARSVDVSSRSEAVTEYYGTDRHGNVTELTDRTGAVNSTYDYSDYGVTSIRDRRGLPREGLDRNPIQYAGEYTDRVGTQFLMTRMYDSCTMRFTSMDRAPLENRFAFADLNPIMHVDPTGQASALDIVNWVVAGTALVLGVASAIGTFWALAVSNTLGALSVTAAVADSVALGFATAGVVDTYEDFMDDETADFVALGDIVLGVGIGLGLGVLDGIMHHTDRALRTVTTKTRRASQLDHSTDAEKIQIGPPITGSTSGQLAPTIDDAVTRLDQWRALKERLRVLTLRGEGELTRTAKEGLVRKLEQDPLFMRVSGLHAADGAPIAATFDAGLLGEINTQELLTDPLIKDPSLYKTNFDLVKKGRAMVLKLSAKSYVT